MYNRTDPRMEALAKAAALKIQSQVVELQITTGSAFMRRVYEILIENLPDAESLGIMESEA